MSHTSSEKPMVKFRAYFTHIRPEVVEAESGSAAREIAAAIARQNRTFVTKVKRVRS